MWWEPPMTNGFSTQNQILPKTFQRGQGCWHTDSTESLPHCVLIFFIVILRCKRFYLEEYRRNIAQLNIRYATIHRKSLKSSKTTIIFMYTVKTLVKAAPRHKNQIFLVSSCSCICWIHWNQEWRCNWSSTDRQCSSYIWVISNFNSY